MEQAKKNKKDNHFCFKVDSLLIEIHSPIPLLKGGKTMKLKAKDKATTTYNISNYIMRDELSENPTSSVTPVRGSTSVSATNHHLLTPNERSKDERLSRLFCPSSFQKEMMKKALILRPRQYKNKISAVSKINCNLCYNKHQWTPITKTKEFHDISTMNILIGIG